MPASLVPVTGKKRILGPLPVVRLSQGSRPKPFPLSTVCGEGGTVAVFLNSGQGGGSEADEARRVEGRGETPRTRMQASREVSYSLNTRRVRGGPRMGQITLQ